MDADDETLQPDELVTQLTWVRGLARGLVSDPEASRDIVQQVCLLALQQAPPGARTGPPLRAWLAAVARSLARRRVRTERRRARREEIAARPEALAATVDTAAHREALRQLIDAVTALQEPYYSAVVARYFEERSVAEIAARSGDTAAAVRQRLSRARRQLRERLESSIAADPKGTLRAALPLAATSRTGHGLRSLFSRFGGSMARSVGRNGSAKVAAGLVALLLLMGGAWLALREQTPSSSAASLVPDVASEDTPRAPAALPAPAAGGVQGLLPATGTAAAAPVLRRAPSGERTQRVTGLVVDESHRPVADAVAEILDAGAPADPDLAMRFDFTRPPPVEVLATAASGPDGRFVLDVAESRARAHRHAQPGNGRPLLCQPLLRVSAPGLLAQMRKLGAGTADDADAGLFVLAAGGSVRGCVHFASGQPVREARVLLRSWAPRGDETTNVELLAVLPEARTSADGCFEVSGVPPGDLAVEIENAGWAILRPDRVAVSRGGTADLGTLTLPDGASLAGTVLDGDGAPLAGADVSLIGQEFLAQTVIARTRSDDRGQFLLEGLPIFVARPLEVRAEGFAPAQVPVNVPSEEPVIIHVATGKGPVLSIRDATGAPAGSGTVELFRNGLPQAEVPILDGAAALRAPNPGVLLVQVPGCGAWAGGVPKSVTSDGRPEIALQRSSLVRGIVRDEQGRALPGLSVRAVAKAQALKDLAFELDVLTDEKGRYEIAGLCAGAWSLQVERAGLVPFTRGVDLGDGEAKVADVVLASGGRVAGRVSTGRGDAVPGVAVRAGPITAPGPLATTDAEGRFEFAGLPSGPRWISLADGTGSVQVEVVAGGVASAQVISPARASISGRVTSGGQPVAGYTVHAGGTGSWNAGPYATRTDESGAFLLENIKPGPWGVGVVDPTGRALDHVDLVLGEGDLQHADFDLIDRTLRVQVRTAGDGRPVPKATVSFSETPRFNAVSRKADAQGVFVLEHVRQDSLWLSASAPGRFPAETTARLTAATGIVDVVLELPPAASIEGVVRVADGGPMLTLSVAAIGPPGSATPEELQSATQLKAWNFGRVDDPTQDTTGAAVRSAEVDRDGRFTIDGLSPGRWRVAVTQALVHDRQRHVVELDSRAVDVVAGEVARVELSVQPVRSP